MESGTSSLGEGRETYETLNWLRGVAAILVAVFHFEAFFGKDAVPSGYLAVDLFFLLSGFVIANAYLDRLRGGMPARQFMMARAIRLFPLYLFGTGIGIGAAWLAFALGAGLLSGPALLLATVSSLAMLPSPTWHETIILMPINVPGWSLFFELAANLAFVLLWPKLTTRYLAAVVAVSGAGLLLATLMKGDVDLGAAWPTLAGGFLRVSCSFFAGVLLFKLFRHRKQHHSKLAYLVPLLFAASLFLDPGQGFGRVAYDLICVFALFPALVYFGARLSASSTGSLGFLGTTSYSVYVLHMPVYMLATTGLSVFGFGAAPWQGVVLLCGLIATSSFLTKSFDEPVRRKLSNRVRDSAPKEGIASRRIAVGA